MKLHLLSLDTFLLHYWESAVEATGMYGPAHSLDRGTCPGTNGSAVKRSVKYTHLTQ